VQPSLKASAPDPNWIVGKHALLNIESRIVDGRTVLEPRVWRIPFQWQGYHYQDHDDEPFLPLLNCGGGFVEGDVSQFHADLCATSRTLITTTSASKFYKSVEGQTSVETVVICVGENALLEYCPDEAIPYERSRVRRITRIDITASSRVYATDILAAGRIHYGSGEAFKFHSLLSQFEISINGRPVILDRLAATTPDAVAALPRLWGGATHLATAFGYAPDMPPRIDDAVDAVLKGSDGTVFGVSRIGNFVVVRMTCQETWQAHDALFKVWRVLRPVIANKPARPIRKC
jgi:urease accessory protein